MLNISNVQHFSTGDGDGIRTTVFFKGCNLRCPWCHNPENLDFAPTTLSYHAICKTELRGETVCDLKILPELLEDKDFFTQSGGGVTFSGGEVMLQAKNAANLAKELYNNGVSVLIDTAGCVPYSQFELLNPFVTGYLFDFKTADADKYQSIGGELELVTENISRLIKDGMNVYIRIPVIPGFNNDKASTEKICKCLSELGIKEVTLLPFHRLGRGKYEAMGMEYAYKDVLPLSGEELYEIKKQYSKYFKVKTER